MEYATNVSCISAVHYPHGGDILVADMIIDHEHYGPDSIAGVLFKVKSKQLF